MLARTLLNGYETQFSIEKQSLIPAVIQTYAVTGFEIRSATDTDTENRLIEFTHSDATLRAQIGHETTADLVIRNQINSGHVLITAENSAGTPHTLIEGDPDAGVELYYNNVLKLEVLGSGVRVSGSLFLDDSSNLVLGTGSDSSLAMAGTVTALNTIGSSNNFILSHGTDTAIDSTPDEDVALYYNNIESLRTADYSAADAASGAEVAGPDGTFRYVGFNLLPRVTISGGNHTLDQDDQGKVLFYNEATARSLLLNDDSDIPVDAYFAYTVGATGGTLTGDGGTGVVINWWNGAGWTATAAAANMTIGEGSGTIWKLSDTEYYITGPNLS